jgi:signal transduction histidine kinase
MAEPILIPERVIRVMLVDDDEDDAFLTRELLANIPSSQFSMDWEPDYTAARDAMGRCSHDVYLIDYRLGDRTGLDLIREANRQNCAAPLILLTGQGQQAVDLEAMRAGAADYLEKSKLDATMLERAIRYSMQNKQSEEELEQRVLERTRELAEANASLQHEIEVRIQAEEALREADHRKDEFIATLAHELRNPLAPIRYALEIMRLSVDSPDDIERCRAIMERQVGQMVRLIDDLLDISRLTRGKIQLQKQPVDLLSIVESAIEASRPNIDAGQHQLLVKLPDKPIILEADSTRLSQVLMNLLNNAAKYMEPNGKIELTGELVNNRVILRVRDYGIGIPTEMLPNIFNMFAMTERNREHTPGGLGVGLWLVRRLVELHGGTVEAHSEGPGRGSEFVVSLPPKTS